MRAFTRKLSPLGSSRSILFPLRLLPRHILSSKSSLQVRSLFPRIFSTNSPSQSTPSTQPNTQPTTPSTQPTATSSTQPTSTHPSSAAVQKPVSPLSRWLRQYSVLSKARLASLVIFSTGAGYALVPGLTVFSWQHAATLLGTWFCVAAANAFNQTMEVNQDSRMERTRSRPMVTGAMSRTQGAMYGVGQSILGGAILSAVSPPCALMGVANIALYAGVYTPLKQISSWNTAVGAVVGALPPVMGYISGMYVLHPTAIESLSQLAALTWSLSTQPIPLFLFGVQFFWQLLHFMALQWEKKAEYTKGGFEMLSKNDNTGKASAFWALSSAGLLALAPAAAVAADLASPLFLLSSMAVTIPGVVRCWQFRNDPDRYAGALFKLSLLYLFVFLTLFWFHHHPRTSTASSSVGEANKDMCIYHRLCGGHSTEDVCVYRRIRDKFSFLLGSPVTTDK